MRTSRRLKSVAFFLSARGVTVEAVCYPLERRHHVVPPGWTYGCVPSLYTATIAAR